MLKCCRLNNYTNRFSRFIDLYKMLIKCKTLLFLRVRFSFGLGYLLLHFFCLQFPGVLKVLSTDLMPDRILSDSAKFSSYSSSHHGITNNIGQRARGPRLVMLAAAAVRNTKKVMIWLLFPVSV